MNSVLRSLLVLAACSGFVWLLSSGTAVSQLKNPGIESPDKRTSNRIQTIVSEVRHELITLPYYNVFDWLEGEVKPVNPNSALMMYGLRSVPPIHIIVENGHATLKGVVASEMDKQLAYTAARSVPGLFDVKNELMVEKPTSN